MPAREVVQTVPSIEEAVRIQKFWEDHHEQLLREFPEHFVAMRDDEIVASDPDLAMLVSRLRDLGLDPRTGVAIEFVTDWSQKLLL